MSLLFVSYDQATKEFTKITISRMMAKFMFANVLVPLVKWVEDGEFLDKAEADLMIENVNLSDLTQDEFIRAYDLIKQNIANPILEPYADELLTKMEADPRFEHELG